MLYWIYIEFILNLYWNYIEIILKLYWIYIEFILNLYWIYIEFILNLYWIYIEFILNLYWIILNLYWIYIEFILNLYWIYIEFILNLYWIYIEFILNLLLYFEFIMNLYWIYIVYMHINHKYIYIMCSRVKLKDGVGTKMWSPKRCQWSWNMLELGQERIRQDSLLEITWTQAHLLNGSKWQLLNFAKHIERHELDGKQCKTSCKWSVAADDWICSAGAARDIKS